MFLGGKGNGEMDQGDFKEVTIILFEKRNEDGEIRKKGAQIKGKKE